MSCQAKNVVVWAKEMKSYIQVMRIFNSASSSQNKRVRATPKWKQLFIDVRFPECMCQTPKI